MNRNHSSPISRISLYILLFGFSSAMLLPLVWMIGTSFKSFSEVYAQPPVWIPSTLHWENYTQALTQFSFLLYFRNSCIATSLVVLGILVSSSLVAYAFARMRAPGSNVLFAVMLSTMMLPAQVTIIPLFMIFRELGWINTYFPLVVPAWLGTNAFSIFLLRQFFRTIPWDYSEAAKVDGCSDMRILLQIILPLSKPALYVVAVFSFIGAWNDLWTPLIYLMDQEKYTLPIALVSFIGFLGTPQGTQWQLMMAASTVTMIPIIIVFSLAQRSFIEGITITGLKA